MSKVLNFKSFLKKKKKFKPYIDNLNFNMTIGG